MPSARDIVEHYFEALYRGDASTARSYLADDLSFRGPVARLSNADQYMKATEHVVSAIKGVAKRKIFVDGQDVCMFYDLLMDSPAGSIPIAEWYHLEREKISSIQTILDTAPFTSPAATGETAIDPVCGMTVVKESAAATRLYAAATYYFCNPSCADAFDDQPERYASGAA